jgi:hypothetical protein
MTHTIPTPLPPPSDLRVGTMPDVQLVSNAGPYEVEVLVRVLSPADIEIVGQVTWAGRVHEPVSDLELVLYDADALVPVGTARTNHFGEFTLGRLRALRYYVSLGATKDAPCLLIWEGED